MERNIGPLDFVVMRAMLDIRQIISENTSNLGGAGRKEHHLHPIGIGRAADVRPLAVQCLPHRRRERGDVVRECEVLLLRDEQPRHVDPSRLHWGAAHNLPVRSTLDDHRIGKHEEKIPGRLHLRIRNTREAHLGADQSWIARR